MKHWLIAVVAALGLTVSFTGCYTPPEKQKRLHDQQMGGGGPQAPAPAGKKRPRAKTRAARLPLPTQVLLGGATSNLNVREAPKVGAALRFTLKDAEAVQLTQEREGWFLLTHDKGEGWAFGAYLDLRGYGPIRSFQAGQQGVLLFAKPSLGSDAALRLEPGERFLMFSKPLPDGWRTVLLPSGEKMYTR